jgi:hypothetical protein
MYALKGTTGEYTVCLEQAFDMGFHDWQFMRRDNDLAAFIGHHPSIS